MEKTGGKRDTDYKDLKNTKVMMKDIDHKEQNWKDEIWGKDVYSKDKWGI